MYESMRTITVMGGGALGSAAGPAGTALGGIAGGMVTDIATTVSTGKPHGYVESIGDMANDISHNRIPFESGGRTVVLAATDVAGGFAGAAVIGSGNVGAMTALAYRTGRTFSNRS